MSGWKEGPKLLSTRRFDLDEIVRMDKFVVDRGNVKKLGPSSSLETLAFSLPPSVVSSPSSEPNFETVIRFRDKVLV